MPINKRVKQFTSYQDQSNLQNNCRVENHHFERKQRLDIDDQMSFEHD